MSRVAAVVLSLVVAAVAQAADPLDALTKAGDWGLARAGLAQTVAAHPEDAAARARLDALAGQMPTSTVEAVLHGDTLEGHWQAKPQSLGLFGLQAPEEAMPAGAVQAKAFLAGLIFGHDVWIRLPDDKPTLDDDGRLLALLYRAPDGLCLNRAMLAAGYGAVDSDMAGTAAPWMADVEKAAKDAHLGWWSTPPGLSDLSLDAQKALAAVKVVRDADRKPLLPLVATVEALGGSSVVEGTKTTSNVPGCPPLSVETGLSCLLSAGHALNLGGPASDSAKGVMVPASLLSLAFGFRSEWDDTAGVLTVMWSDKHVDLHVEAPPATTPPQVTPTGPFAPTTGTGTGKNGTSGANRGGQNTNRNTGRGTNTNRGYYRGGTYHRPNVPTRRR